MAQRVTQKDIAEKANVHRSTVSLALKNHPGIPQETRERIMQLAKELGYVRDPMLSALAAYSSQSRPVAFHGTLAWMVRSSQEWNWHNVRHYRDYFNGAQAQAASHGYKLEIFDLTTAGMTSKRMASIFKARNIAGILVCPQPNQLTQIDFPWENFASVTFGYTLQKPRLNMITAAHCKNVLTTMRELARRGYKRIGYAYPWEFNERTDYNCLAGYLTAVHLYGFEPIPPLSYDHKGYHQEFRAWVDENRLDAVVTVDWKIKKTLDAAGLECPRDIGVAGFTYSAETPGVSSIVENSTLIGEEAVTMLVSMLHNGERGLSDNPRCILIEGSWYNGGSLRSAQ
ncbi:LacI family DNA-binding transcriptional regulator [Ruficoccus sp. ZRK36]|uniref:LacI family DNA-binding transcriptional regulator n=1 Tax=Ruficoccus sp. ZRK36 TaxID=2866311 RepID=UPI001C72D13A|nr:LacI family DNA-binding transcriptional regulator [Ruficoccus sp. ZRK36]QYY34312.1 LacI family transcriptional regulator [Ruficoccus sp. ZRK36]